MKQLDDFRLSFDEKEEIVPIIVGGMGVDISNKELALEVARMGGIGHISDAMLPTVTDRHYKTRYVKDKLKKYKHNVANSDKTDVKFDLDQIRDANKLHVEYCMENKQGSGKIYINCMEKLTMNNPKETLHARLNAALDAGVDGITLSAGLHLSSFDLMKENKRFRDAKLGIIVSSVRALKLFLKRAARLDRHPDYIVVEGPLAGGHLGFGMDWADYDLKTIFIEIKRFLDEQELNIALIPAGGIFTGSDAVEFMQLGASAVQVATRFTVTEECGLPEKIQQEYFKAHEQDVIVNTISPTGYPMRMLKDCPAIGAGTRPNCEALGYLLDRSGNCAYIDAYNLEIEKHPNAKKVSVQDKTCLCTHMRKFSCWTCGQYTYRLKDTTHMLDNGSYQMLKAKDVFSDYLYSTDGKIALPEKLVEQVE